MVANPEVTPFRSCSRAAQAPLLRSATRPDRMDNLLKGHTYSLLFPFFATDVTGKYPVRVRTVSLLFPLAPAVTSTRRKPGSVVGLVEW